MGALTDKYCIVGVGETPHRRPSNRTTLSMACEAVRNALADAGLDHSEISGITSYQAFDSSPSKDVGSALGMRLDYSLDILGGGSSTEALVANAIGLIEAGYCRNMVIFRSMNGRSGRRPGGQDPGGSASVPAIRGIGEFDKAWGFTTPAQHHSLTCMRYMHDYGLTSRHLGEVAVAHRKHANLNPKAIFYDKPLTMDDYLKGRWISKPFRLFDCCLETDVAAAIIVAPREWAYNLRQPPGLYHGRHGQGSGPGGVVSLGNAQDSPHRRQLWAQAALRHVGSYTRRYRLCVRL